MMFRWALAMYVLSLMGRGSLAIEGGTWDRKPILEGLPFV